jgi:hypothetical protein
MCVCVMCVCVCVCVGVCLCVGITHGVFRNNKSGMENGEDEPKSWQEVSAASERMRGGGEGSDSDDGLEPKDQSVSFFS